MMTSPPRLLLRALAGLSLCFPALNLAACHAPAARQGGEQEGREQAPIKLMDMEVGDRVEGIVHRTGCWENTRVEITLTCTGGARGSRRWALEIRDSRDTVNRETTVVTEHQFSTLGLLDLEWELQYARTEKPIESTSQVRYDLTWYRDDQELVHERLHDESGGWFLGDKTTFLDLLNPDYEWLWE